ncbi:MAG: glycosyltransferase [Kiritimatiellae bacterium]|jgi:processive 1,2-diacylglycerol beta-glucosyltransferase|nr:glycosyltransferase [Kiritimatiellia bacterium]MDY0150123.1 glycosyltransferase [Kiritimatiellia bacterium]
MIRPPRILICYLVRNSGHHAAARAIEAEIHRLNPLAETRCLDLLETTHPTWSAIVQYAYMSTIRRTPELWEALYDNFWFDLLTRRYIRPLVQRGNSHKLWILMEAFQPNAIVCTQAHPLAVLSAYTRRQQQPVPLWGVLTDYLPHRFWYVPPADHIRYVVPTETALQRLMILGTPADNIHIFGIPIQADVLAARRKRLAPSPQRRIVVMGGSRGLGVRFATVRHLDRAKTDFTIDVVTGTNRRLRKKLLAARHKFKHPIRIRGYVQDAMALMHRASLLLGKPGGLTSAEAMAAGTPMLIIRPLPGQERGNTETLVRHGAAIHLDRDRDLPGVVDSLMDNPSLRERMRESARLLGTPNAARDIAIALLSSIPPEEAE